YVLYITAVISINLGVFNLIPFPALDGGRLLFLVFEIVTRKKVNPDIEAKIHLVGIALLMMLMLFVVSKDILSLF
ncbi:MAG: site-2 protease family protein, partial [Clostridia bacterium]|nr:site-2 protease family protein [Clostridia bacterium]